MLVFQNFEKKQNFFFIKPNYASLKRKIISHKKKENCRAFGRI